MKLITRRKVGLWLLFSVVPVVLVLLRFGIHRPDATSKGGEVALQDKTVSFAPPSSTPGPEKQKSSPPPNFASPATPQPPEPSPASEPQSTADPSSPVVSDLSLPVQLLGNAEIKESRQSFSSDRARFEKHILIRSHLNVKYPLLRIDQEYHRNQKSGQYELDRQVEAVADHVLVRAKENVSVDQIQAFVQEHGLKIRRSLKAPGSYLLEVAHVSLDGIASALEVCSKEAALFQVAEPDYVSTTLSAPNDPELTRGAQWALNNIHDSFRDMDALKAWDLCTVRASVLVGIIDSGVDYTHPDLAANMWNNAGEVGIDASGRDKALNGVDDDGNGYVDDAHGWDFYNSDNDPMDEYGHGTYCAGVVGAVANNGRGISGVCPTAKMVALRTQGPDGLGYSSDALEAIYYSTRLGVRLTLNAWGGRSLSEGIRAAIQDAGTSNILFVAAAGNYDMDLDQEPYYPAGLDCTNILSVAASDPDDQLAVFDQNKIYGWGQWRRLASNRGLLSVDLAAPGLEILSTFVSNQYNRISGTSIAAAHAAGACALLESENPAMTALVAKQRLMNTVDRLAAWEGKCVAGGRLNLYNALKGESPSKPSDLLIKDEVNGTVTLSWRDNSAIETGFVIERQRNGASWTDLISSLPVNATCHVDQIVFGTPYAYRVRALGAGGVRSDPSNVETTPKDTDDDGLADVVESGQGFYSSVGNTGTSATNPDTDGDGMPDGWEIKNGFNPFVADGSADADGDGRNNYQEYLAGTDPRNADSFGEASLLENATLGAGWFNVTADPFPAAGPDIETIGFWKDVWKATKKIFYYWIAPPQVHKQIAEWNTKINRWADKGYMAEPDFVPGSYTPTYDQLMLVENCPTFTRFYQGAASVNPEIKELARSLDYNPTRIYEYVHNHIDYAPYYGSHRGAFLTLLDKTGNDFDQASLMIALLKAGQESSATLNYEMASYVFGTMDMPNGATADTLGLANWLGLDAINPSLIENAFAFGGVPVEKVSTGNTRVNRVWVKVKMKDGSVRLFDPAFKQYENYFSSTNLLARIGYTREEFLSTSMVGAMEGRDFIKGVNETNIHTRMAQLSSNLVSYFRAECPKASTVEVLGGRKIVQESVTGSFTQLPYASIEKMCWREIPDLYTASISVELGDIKETFQLPEIAAKRLGLSLDSEGKAQLWLDDEKVVEKVTTVSNLTLYVNHPYPANNNTYSDQRKAYTIKMNGYYVIACDFGGGYEGGLLAHRYRQMERYVNLGYDENTRQISLESLNIVSLTWMREANLSDGLLNMLHQRRILVHHRFGIASKEGTESVDFCQCVSTLFQGTKDYRSDGCKLTSGLLGSAFEYAAFDQIIGGTNKYGVSTVRAFQLANQRGDRFFMVNSQNWSQVQAQIRNYNAKTLQELNKTVYSNGWNLIVMENGQFIMNQWTGSAHIAYLDRNGQCGIGMVIDNNYYGGASSFFKHALIYAIKIAVVCTVNYLTGGSFMPVSGDFMGFLNPVSLEPVDLQTGAYLYDHDDLSIGGEEPFGLKFQHSYNSSRRSYRSPLGFGWAHNYNIFVSTRTDFNAAFGLRTPADAAPMIAAALVSVDLMSGDAQLPEWLTSTLIARWAADQTIENDAIATIGVRSMEFTRMPDGSFIPPPGVTMTMTMSNKCYRLTEKDGTVLQFDATNRISSWMDADSNAMTFAYLNGKLSQVTDCVGRSLTFAYTDSNNTNSVTSIQDPAGRTLLFEYSLDGDLIKYTDPEQQVWQYTYDNDHQILTLVDPEQRVTIKNVYEQGRVVQQVAPEGGIWHFYYSDFCNIEEDPDGYRKKYYFDREGRSLGEENAEGQRNYLFYDGQNHVVKEIDPNGNVSVCQYDDRHNKTNVIDALGFSQSFTFNQNNDLVAETDALGRIHPYQYDSRHHRIKDTDAVGAETLMEYNTPRGLLSKTIDPRGFTTTYEYDSYGNETRVTRPDGSTVVCEYDVLGNKLSETDPLGRKTSYTYDRRDQVLSIRDPLGGVTRRTYYSFGELKDETDPNGAKTSYTYTPSRKLETVRYPDGGVETRQYDARYWVTSVKDPLGRIVSNQYDRAGRMLCVTDPMTNRTRFVYDANGNQVSTKDALGYVTSNRYDALNRVIAKVDPMGGEEKVYYDAAGQMVSNINVRGFPTHYEYDAAGRKVRTTQACGVTTRLGYDLSGNITTQIDARGFATVMTYDSMNRVISIRDALNNRSTRSYDLAGNLISITDPLNRTTAFVYDGLGHKVRTVYPDQTADQVGYDAKGQPIRTLDARGVVTRMTYDGMGRKISLTDGMGNTSRWSYDLVGNLISSTDAEGRTTEYQYDGLNRKTRVTYPDGSLEQAVYDAVGNVLVSINPNNHATTNSYDALRRLVSTKDYVTGQGEVVLSMAYDAAGNLVAKTDANANATRYHYDGLNRLTNTVYAHGAKEALEYDPNGNKMALINRLQKRTSFAYDPLNRLVAVTNKLGAVDVVESAQYDVIGNKSATVDAEGRLTRFYYDSMNRLTNVVYPVTSIQETYVYDSVGNKIQAMDPNNLIISTAYDPLNRVVAVTNTVPGVTNLTVLITYDKVGNKVSDIDEDGLMTRYFYDRMNRLTNVVFADNSKESHVYDSMGHRTLFTDGEGHTISYTYDDLGRLIQTRDGLNNPETRAYDKGGNLKYLKDAENRETFYSHDAVNNLTNIFHGAQRFAWFRYDADSKLTEMNDAIGQTTNRYDDLGRLVYVRDPNNLAVTYTYDKLGNTLGITYPDNKTASYSYDPMNRMTNVVIWGGRTTSYSYGKTHKITAIQYPNGIKASLGRDKFDRITNLRYYKVVNGVETSVIQRAMVRNGKGLKIQEQTVAGLAPSFLTESEGLTYNAANQVVSRAAGATTKTYKHDRAGNLTNENNVLAFTYDYENRLIGYRSTSTTNAYRYNGLGDRITRIVSNVTNFDLLDYGSDLHNVLMSRPVGGRVTNYYVWGVGLLAQVSGTNSALYYHPNELGDILGLSDSAGTMTDQFVYDLYGKLVQRTGTNQTPYLFGGGHGLWFEGDNLYNAKARYYSTDLKRFISQDPMGIDGGHNLYAYANDNPLMYVDPSGWCASGLMGLFQIAGNIASSYAQVKFLADPNWNTMDLIGQCNTVASYNFERAAKMKELAANAQQTKNTTGSSNQQLSKGQDAKQPSRDSTAKEIKPKNPAQKKDNMKTQQAGPVERAKQVKANLNAQVNKQSQGSTGNASTQVSKFKYEKETPFSPGNKITQKNVEAMIPEQTPAGSETFHEMKLGDPKNTAYYNENIKKFEGKKILGMDPEVSVSQKTTFGPYGTDTRIAPSFKVKLGSHSISLTLPGKLTYEKTSRFVWEDGVVGTKSERFSWSSDDLSSGKAWTHGIYKIGYEQKAPKLPRPEEVPESIGSVSPISSPLPGAGIPGVDFNNGQEWFWGCK